VKGYEVERDGVDDGAPRCEPSYQRHDPEHLEGSGFRVQGEGRRVNSAGCGVEGRCEPPHQTHDPEDLGSEFGVHDSIRLVESFQYRV
jgi:hypothetical protein